MSCLACGAPGEPFPFACLDHWERVPYPVRAAVWRSWAVGTTADYIAA